MRGLERLPANVVRNVNAMKPGKYADGGGLYLWVRKTGGAQWTFRYRAHGQAGEMGLGSVRDVGLKAARAEARRWRDVVRAGLHPKKERDRLRAQAAKTRPTLAHVVKATFEARKASLKRDGDAGRWMSPLSVHILPKLGKTPIEDIDQRDLHAALAPIWHETPEAARKAVNRLNLSFKHAAAMGLDVDLQVVAKAKALLGAQRHTVQHVPALPWADVPKFFSTLDGGTVAERALRLLILTAARSGEIRHIREDEIVDGVWIIPASRTKTGIEHRIPLSQAAQEIVAEAAPLARDGYLFPGVRKGVISDMTLTALMKRRGMTERPHGFRTSFRTWCAEATDTPREVAEECLAHKSGGSVELAYRRTDFLERRAVLMERWAEHICGNQGPSFPR